MQEVIFEVETITPLFLAGADQSKAELRAPSFRGEMRYWLRALVGGLVGTDQEGLTKVRDAETLVFGATDQGSAVQLRILGLPEKTLEFRKESRGRDVSGKDYLLWSMEQFRDKPRRQYFPQGTTFQLTLSTRGKVSHFLDKGIAALWLFTHLGGIGSRSRRCAGSLNAIGNTTTFPFSTHASAQALQEQFLHGIRKAQSLYPYNVETPTVRDAFFDALSPSTCRIWILRNGENPWHSADEAMRFIGGSLQDYRRTITPLWRRKIFGLPLKDVDMRTRIASPLLLRVTKLQGEKYVGVAVLFKTKGEGVSMSDYALIEKWVTQDFPKALQVAL